MKQPHYREIADCMAAAALVTAANVRALNGLISGFPRRDLAKILSDAIRQQHGDVFLSVVADDMKREAGR